MEAFLISTGSVALAEIGDKTQLLALVLAARHRQPVPIILGILVATLANHTLAGAIGSWLTSLVAPPTMRWIVGLSFIGMALWTLMPDEVEPNAVQLSRRSVFGATLSAFFLTEMGDKTQVATVPLAAQYPTLLAVVAGATCGMLLANAPAVLMGGKIADHLPVR